MKAVILAGGFGTRLASITGSRPKCLVEIDDRPLLDHQLRLLAANGVDDVVLLVSHGSDEVTRFAGDGSRWGISVRCAREESPMGTAGSLSRLSGWLTDHWLLLYGDIMLDVDLQFLMKWHISRRALLTVVAHANDHPADSDMLAVDSADRLTRVLPKPRGPAIVCRNLVCAGLYAVSPDLTLLLPAGRVADFARDVLPRATESGRVYVLRTPEYLKDLGTPERLKQARDDVARGLPARLRRRNPRTAVFLDRDGVLNEHVGLLHEPVALRLLQGAAEAVRRLNRCGHLAIVITNQSVVARNLCSLADLAHIHAVLEAHLGERGAWLDDIYVCPHHPDAGYPEENPRYKRECQCRKPRPGLVLRAARDWNIDLRESWFVGDSSRDIECGKRAGTRTVLIAGGEAPAGERRGERGDTHLAPSLSAAVELILERAVPST